MMCVSYFVMFMCSRNMNNNIIVNYFQKFKLGRHFFFHYAHAHKVGRVSSSLHSRYVLVCCCVVLALCVQMGCAESVDVKTAAARSRDIDRVLRRDRDLSSREVKLLLLGERYNNWLGGRSL